MTLEIRTRRALALKLVIEKEGINAERVTMRALAKGKGGGVTRLLEAGINPDASVMTGNWEHMTSLTTAGRYGQEHVILLLLVVGAEKEARESALWWAIDEGHKGAIKALLTGGCNVDAGAGDRLGAKFQGKRISSCPALVWSCPVVGG